MCDLRIDVSASVSAPVCLWGLLDMLCRPFEGTTMKQLVTNIINKPTPPLPAQYSVELKALVKAMLSKDYRQRPSVNSVLAQSIMRERITNILDDHVRQVPLLLSVRYVCLCICFEG